MTLYPKLRVIAIYVLKRISAATSRLANKLAEDYERDVSKQRQIESVQEAITAKLNTGPSNEKLNIDSSTANSRMHDGEEQIDAMEISPPRTQSFVGAADENSCQTVNEDELRNGQHTIH